MSLHKFTKLAQVKSDFSGFVVGKKRVLTGTIPEEPLHIKSCFRSGQP